jgi:ABC-type sugar transport system substrate-binding protein
MIDIRTAKINLCAATVASALAIGAFASANMANADGVAWELRKSPETIAAAKAAGLADAARAGGKVAAPKGKKLGLILLSLQSAANVRIAATAKSIGKMFDFDVIVCDPDFDAQKVVQCATSIVAQKPDAVMSDAHEPAALGSSLNDAHEMGIPWFALVVNVSPSAALMQYGITGREVGSVYDDWLLNEIAKRKGKDKPHSVMAIGAPALGLALLAQQQQLVADIKDHPGAQLAVLHDLDLPNAVQDTLNITKQTLGQHPDLGGTWTVCDFCVPLMAQVVDGEGLSGDLRPVLGGNYTTAQSVDLMRKGKLDGLVDIPFESSIYVVFDQLLEKWARGHALDSSADIFSKAYSLKFMEPYMVTKENVGASGAIPIFGSDYEDYFMAKWGAEFGVKN